MFYEEWLRPRVLFSLEKRRLMENLVILCNSWQEWGVRSAPRQPAAEEDTVLSCPRGCLGWPLGRIFHAGVIRHWYGLPRVSILEVLRKNWDMALSATFWLTRWCSVVN